MVITRTFIWWYVSRVIRNNVFVTFYYERSYHTDSSLSSKIISCGFTECIAYKKRKRIVHHYAFCFLFLKKTLSTFWISDFNAFLLMTA